MTSYDDHEIPKLRDTYIGFDIPIVVRFLWSRPQQSYWVNNNISEQYGDFDTRSCGWETLWDLPVKHH